MLFRSWQTGSLEYRGFNGEYWSSEQSQPDAATMLHLASNAIQLSMGLKSFGYTLRCVKDLLPTVTTTAVTSITSSTASSGGNVADSGGYTVTARGVCWGTSTGPTVALTTKTTDGTGTGTFTSAITGLTANTPYYVRAYATNSAGTAYGDEVSFKTIIAIGDAYQGGIVVYFFQSGNPGYVAGETHGLIASPYDNSAGIPWGPDVYLAVFGLSIGDGPIATRNIVDALGPGNYAAYLCDTLTLNGYSDWYLPSKDELRNLSNIVAGGTYWTSLESNTSFAYNIYFTSPPYVYAYNKSESRRVRAFRSF